MVRDGSVTVLPGTGGPVVLGKRRVTRFSSALSLGAAPLLRNPAAMTVTRSCLKMLLGAEDPGSQPSDWMMKPYGVAVSPEGRLYVADTAARRVFAFDMDAKTVSFVGESGAVRLTKPIGVAVDDRGTVFVADGTLK